MEMINFVYSKEELTKREKEKESVKTPKNINNEFGKEIFLITFSILEITKAWKFKLKVKGNTVKKPLTKTQKKQKPEVIFKQ